MKKLMIASAIAVAAFALKADITSANVVGYQQIETDGTGNVMIAPTFLKVSESNAVTLADLKVTGYTPPAWQKVGKVWKNVGGCTGQFVMQTLTTSGLMENAYYWLDYTTSATTKVGPGWFANPDGTEIPGGQGAVTFDAGKALWISGSGYSLQPTGAVNPFDVEFKTDETGNVAVGNCMPVGTKLSDLTVTGYTPPAWQKVGKVWKNVGGCTGQFVVQTLTTSGLMEKAYYWLDYTTSATAKVGPGWFANPDGTPIENGADKVILDPGKGLWVSGSGYNLIVPAPEL